MKLAYIYNSDDLHKLYVFDEFIDKVLAMPIVIMHSDLKYSKNLPLFATAITYVII